MGIYIKGMEMPKNCFDCPLFDDVYTDADGDDDYICGLGVPLDYYQASGKTKKDCPLVPIQPHWRLIDEKDICDKIRPLIENPYCYNRMRIISDTLAYCLQIISDVPTVIPASESKERPAFLPQYELTPRSEEGET